MEKYTGLEVAVIGLAGRFPKAGNVQQYWENLKDSLDCIETFTVEEALKEGESESSAANPGYVKAHAYLQNKNYFDSHFFGYRPDEAELMDPQIRLFHECCWAALEDSGYDVTNHDGKIGLFAGGAPNFNWEAYARLKNKDGRVDDFTATRLRRIFYLCSRISYKLNLKGPSVFVQSGCSTSLVAIHNACNSLLIGECAMALAGGVSIVNHSKQGYLFKEGLILSRDGKCRPFDAGSNGTVGGEGVGIVVLKRLKDAMGDRDHIYAVIKGTGINNDGNDKVGYTAPSVNGQTDVIKMAHKMARVAPDSISYVEAHGTATELGDPIEIAALNAAFGRSDSKYCGIGSVKSNLGHLDTAAGVAGFIKTVLSIQHRQIPASLHYTKANPRIGFDNGPFYVNSSLKAWENQTGPLRAGVSSFGIGGTNVHVVLEEPPAMEPPAESRKFQLVVLSAKTQPSLERSTAQLLDHFKKNPGCSLPDAAYTMQKGRARFRYGRMLVCESVDELVGALSAGKFAQQELANSQAELQNVVFMFSGQGAQYSNMCRGLYRREAAFTEKIDECLQIAASYSQKNFRAVLMPEVAGNAVPAAINNTAFTQPLLFMVEYAMACQLMAWGVKPAYMIGHSIGEYVAACLSGVFSLDDAICLVIRRGELMERVAGGSMLNVHISQAELQPLLNAHPNIDLAVINSGESLVVAGNEADIAQFEEHLVRKGYHAKKLFTSHAFHSSMMDPVLDAFEKEFEDIEINEPQIPYVSNLTGEIVQYDQIRFPSYWSRHLRNAVNFKKGVETLLKEGNAVFIELGPGRTLCNYMAESNLKTPEHHLVNMVRQPKQEADDQKYLIEKMGQLWLCGVGIDWNGYYRDEKRSRISLPTYSFDKTPYTADVNALKLLAQHWETGASGAGDAAEDCIKVPGWQLSLSPNDAGELADHSFNFVVISNGEDFSEHLAQYLTARKQNVIGVKLGNTYRRDGNNAFEVDLDRLSELWVHLESSGVVIHQVVYCAALSGNPPDVSYGNTEEKLEKGYLGLSYLAKALGNSQQAEGTNLTVIANGVAKVTAADEIDPLKAALLGPAKLIPLEMQSVKCRVIDIAYPSGKKRELEETMSRLVSEIFYDAPDPIVAYRDQERWVQSYQGLTENEKIKSGAKIIDGGTYLITGGLGGMGLTFASHLVRDFNADVIIVHRSAFPEREEWHNWLSAREAGNPVSQKIKVLLDMVSTGRSVELYRADVANENQVQQLVRDIHGKHQHLNGLIWAAGEVDFGGIMLNRKKSDFYKYVSSKVHGLLLFEKYLDFKRLDFISLFSSIGNVLYQNKFGQVAYSGANEFLESYAHYAQRKLGVHVFTINWRDWLDVGMTVSTIRRKTKTQDIGLINAGIHDGISPSAGVAIFHRCLNNKSAAYTIYKGDLPAAIRASRKKLREIKALLTEPGEADGVAARQEDGLVEKLVAIYCRFFGKSDIGLDENFFELGGDSLKGMTLIARINQEVGLKLSIKDVYEHPTISQLADQILRQAPVKPANRNIPKAAPKENYVLSAGQQKMYFLSRLDPGTTVYNEVQLFWVAGKLDKRKLEKAVNRLVERHENLRTVFVLNNEAPRQVILDKIDFKVEYFQFDEGGVEATVRSFIRPYDLAKAPLFRVGIIEKEPQVHLMLIDIHHIITDLVSSRIFREDLIRLYNGDTLPDLQLQYKDYAEWQQGEEQQEEMNKQKLFWLSTFSAKPPALALPFDFVRPPVKTYQGRSLHFVLEESQTEGLQALAEREGCTLFMVVLSVFNVLLSKLSNQQDIVVGVPVAGRQHADLEQVMGMFVNTLPVRNYPLAELTFVEFLARVKATTLACLEHQEYPYEELVHQLRLERDAGRNPLFDVILNYRNFTKSGGDEVQPAGLTFKSYAFEHTKSKLDLTLWVTQAGEQLQFDLEYATDLFSRQTVEKLADYLLNIIDGVCADPALSLADIQLLSHHQHEQLAGQLQHYAVTAQQDLVAASYHQERLWFIDKFEAGYLYPAGPLYHNIPLVIDLQGPLDLERLQAAMQTLIERHSILRTVIVSVDQKPYQHVLPALDFSLVLHQAGGQTVQAWLDQQINTAFALDQPLLRGALLQLAPGLSKLIITFHHLIVDRYSILRLNQQLWALYHQLPGSQPPPRPALQYAHFSRWQHECLSGREVDLLAYWKRQLGGKLKALELPTDRPRAAIHVYSAGVVEVVIAPALLQGLLSYQQQHGVSPGLVLMAAFKVLLYKYCRHEEIVIGTSVANRELPGLEEVIGPVSNLLALRSYVSDESSFEAYLAALGEVYQQALSHQAMPFDKLVRELAPEKDMSRTALFDVFYTYEEAPVVAQGAAGPQVQVEENNYGYGKYDLNLWLQRSGPALKGKLVYNRDYFDAATVEALVGHYYQALANLLAQPQARLGELELLSRPEKEQLLDRFDNTQVDYPQEQTVVTLFEQQVQKTPHALALVFGEQQRTYQELYGQALTLAEALSRQGVGADSVVGLLTDRGLETVTGMLAILLAGGAYLPIDVDYPPERIRYLIQDSRCRLVLTKRAWQPQPLAGVTTLYLEDYLGQPEGSLQPDESWQRPVVQPSHLCYVIYTSGTTGEPKGVMIEHANLVRLFFNQRPLFDFKASDVWTMFHSHCFDFSVWEMYGALLFGGKLVIVPKAVARDTAAYLALLQHHQVSVLNQTPSAFYALQQQAFSGPPPALALRYVIFGGEALSPGRLQDWHACYPQCQLINMFGITETTVHVTYKQITALEIAQNVSNVGTPIPTLGLCLLDAQGRLVPQGMVGELYVAGAGLARGYLHRPELTGLRFVADPNRPGRRLYRSGDQARWLASGELEYLGRLDEQVKIRGYRIELGEIEHHLLTYPPVRDGVVVARQAPAGPPEPYLVAYYSASATIPVELLRQHLLGKLPEYMVPAFFVQLEQLPLTPNGKLDRKALPEPRLSKEEDFQPPASPTEAQLLDLWAQVLKLDKSLISVTSNFFQLGGHSLRAFHLVGAIRQAFQVNIHLRNIFENPTISGLSEIISNLMVAKELIIPKIDKQDYYETSPAQERLYYQHLVNPESIENNISIGLKFKEAYTAEGVEKAVQKLVDRHESLRTNFILTEEGVKQVINDKVDFRLERVDAQVHYTAREAFRDFVRPFNLSSGCLMRCALYRGEGENLLFIDIHHIVCDGVSFNVLVKDLLDIQQEKELQPLELRYVDYAYWVRSVQSSSDKQWRYWEKKLAGKLPRLDLPIQRERVLVKNNAAAADVLVLEGEHYEAIRDLATKNNVSVYMFLLSVYYLLLHKVCGASDIIIGTDVVGRTHPGLKNIVGTFVNVLPLRLKVWEENTCREFLDEVKNVVLEAVANQDIQFERMVTLADEDEKDKTARKPIFDVYFSLRNTFEASDQMAQLGLVQADLKADRTTNFEFKIEGWERDGRLNISFIYNVDLYHADTISLLMRYYMLIALAVTKRTDLKIKEIALENSFSEV
jgi:amino acid adenylation domain-containing protein